MRSRQRAMSSSSSTTHPEQESTTTTNTTQGDDETIRHDSNNQQEVDVNHTFYDDNVLDFASLGVQSPILLERLHKLGFHRPAAVQAQAFQDMAAGDQNITLGAETGKIYNKIYMHTQGYYCLVSHCVQEGRFFEYLGLTDWKVGCVGDKAKKKECSPPAASPVHGRCCTCFVLDRVCAPAYYKERNIRCCNLPGGNGSSLTHVTMHTGSGKTLAYLLPLMDDILQRKQLQKLDKEEEAEEEEEGGTWEDKGKTLGYDYARAIILVPNKELVQQVIRMALPLAGGPQALVYGGATLVDLSILGNHTFTHQGGGRGLSSSSGSDSEGEEQKTLVRLAILPGGLKEPSDFPPFRQMLGGKAAPVDLIIATPATLGPFGLKPRNIAMFADVETLVIDEADMLLDGGYIRSLEQVLMGFRRADRLDYSLVGNKKKTQHVFVAATIPDSGLRSVDAFLSRKFPTSKRMTMTGMHKARHSGLAKNTVWIEEDSYKERMAHMCQLLDTPSEEGGLRNDKVMVFLSTVKDVEGVCDALAQAGFQALTYHADLSLKDRTKVLNEFRRYEKPQQEQPYNQDNVESDVEDVDKESSSQEETNGVPILVCTDLASRGLDVPGVTAIVQMQFASNVVAHLHRMGRCGRAGQRVGRGIVYFSSKEKPLVDVVRQAEQEQVREGESATGLTLQGPDVVETPQMEDSAEQNNDDDNDSKMESIRQREAGTVNQAFSRKRGFTKKRKKYRKLAEAAAAEATAAVEEED